jgi:hypothetical protein
VKIRQILEKVVKDISQEYGIPEEEVWEAVLKLKEMR